VTNWLRWLPRRFDAIERRLVEQDQRLARMIMPGKVAEVDAERYRVRLELGIDAETGNAVLSPWVKWQSAAAGQVRDWTPPSVGEAMLLLSPSGTIGTGSRAMFGTFDDDHPPPTNAGNTRMWSFGDATVTFKGDALTLKVGDAEVTLTGTRITVAVGGAGFELSADELAMTTLFRGRGGSRPAHYAGGVDSDGDTAISGNDQVLV